jgi:hypothetical protein
MAPRTLYLLSSRQFPKRQRTHFSLWSPYPNQPSGTKVHVTGTPFTGYGLEFERNYNPSLETERFEQFEIGVIDEIYMYDPPAGEGAGEVDGGVVVEITARCEFERVARMVKVPGKCEDVFAAVDEVCGRSRGVREWESC